MMPSVPPAAMAPANRRWSYFSARACGIATVATVAAVATEEPDVAENIVAVPILAWISPPGSQENQASSAS